jgi:hypothetical protein
MAKWNRTAERQLFHFCFKYKEEEDERVNELFCDDDICSLPAVDFLLLIIEFGAKMLFKGLFDDVVVVVVGSSSSNN